jgi:polysaccharide export outer membrane protein
MLELLRNYRNQNIFLLLAIAIAIDTTSTARPLTAQVLPTVNRFESSTLAQPGYTLGPGDQIDITVFDYTEFTGQKVILSDGTITLPLVGAVMAANRTPEQLTQELTARLQVWLKNPVVTIGLVKLRPLQITVAGEVQRPGPIQLGSITDSASTSTGDSAASQIPTVMSALLQAGGITQDADIRQITLRRRSLTGEPRTITINLWNAIASDQAPQDLLLQDGDALFVPKLSADNVAEQSLAARSSLAPRTVRVRVIGEVKNPGELEVPPSSSLSSAIAIAGGPTDKASLKRVQFVRLNKDGRVEKQSVDLSLLTDTYQVREGDVVVVPKAKTSKVLDLGNQLLSPLVFFLNLFK